jgi:hypothetical protein
MKANLLKSLVGIVLLGLAGAANATIVSLPSSPDGPALSPGDQGLIPTTSVTGSFSNDWYFTLASISALGGAVTSIDLTIAAGLNTAITGLTATLIDLTTTTTVASGTSFLVPSLAPDKYDLRVSGTATGSLGGIYSGAVAVAATPVPLPAAAWLLLSGLAGVGAMARRRKSERLV